MIAFPRLAWPGGKAPLSRGRWGSRGRLERRLALLLTVCAIIAGVTTYAVIAWAPMGEPETRTVLVLLNIDLVLLLLLGIVVARRLVRLVAERRRGRAGSRLHVRLVALFGLLAATPAIVVAIFSVVFLSSGLEYWFSARVSAALENSLAVAEAYLDEHKEVIRADALAMAADLGREGPGLVDDPPYLRDLLVAQAALRSLTEAILVDGLSGRVLAYSGLGLALEVSELPAETLERAARGEIVTFTSGADDRVRAVLRVEGMGDLLLVIGRFVDPLVLGFMDRTQQVVADYRQLASQRSDIQITSALIFGVVALLLLLAAVWVGTNLADRLALPIGRLIVAAERVGRGDLRARVPDSGEDELGQLARAFNRMTDELASQRRELEATNEQLDGRRRFTEAVLEGVTAGIVGLDAERRVVLPNAHAAALLGVGLGDGIGRPLEDSLPEITPLFQRLAADPPAGEQHPGADEPASPAEPLESTVRSEIVLQRGQTKRILLVRLAAQREGGRTLGYVVTFDDVTELVGAQRQAAWSEVARRIAHEIKNPLTPIRLSAERLSRRFVQQIVEADRESFTRSVTTIIRQVDTIGRLVSEFSAFARMPQATLRFERLDEILKGAVGLQQAAAPQIRFELDLPEGDTLVIPCDAEKLAQVCNNLLQNSVNAVIERDRGDGRAAAGAHGGTRQGNGPATVATGEACGGDATDQQLGTVLVRARREPAAVVVEMSDDGPGFPTEDRDRLLEPYFTTRAKGTGLGLAIVRKIMEEHQGRVELAEGPLGGALVRLTFPVGLAEPQGHAGPAAARSASGAAASR